MKPNPPKMWSVLYIILFLCTSQCEFFFKDSDSVTRVRHVKLNHVMTDQNLKGKYISCANYCSEELFSSMEVTNMAPQYSYE